METNLNSFKLPKNIFNQFIEINSFFLLNKVDESHLQLEQKTRNKLLYVFLNLIITFFLINAQTQISFTIIEFKIYVITFS